MGLAARRRLAVLVPWAALAAVTVFALVQMRARHEAEHRGPEPAPTTSRGPAPTSEEDAALREAVARVLEQARSAADALDAALKDREAALEDADREAAARRAAEARAEEAAAALAAAEDRLEATAAAVTDAEAADAQERQALQAQVAALEEKVANLECPPRKWLADAASGDAGRLAEARRAAAGATEEDVATLRTLVGEEPARADAAALLLPHLPAGDRVDELAEFVLLADGGAASRVRRLDRDMLARLLPGMTATAPAEVVEEGLRLLAGRLPELSEGQRAGLTDELRTRLRGHGGWPRTTTLAVAAAFRLDGLAEAVATLLSDEDATNRAVAAYALSRLPDLEKARTAAVRALPHLLMDEAPDVRIAGLHLAEALLGRTVDDYDPAAGKAARREAVDRLLERL